MNSISGWRKKELYMGVSIGRIVRLLVPLLTFFIVLDFEFTLTQLQGAGERVGFTDVMNSGILVRRGYQSVPLKMSDMLCLGTFVLLLLTLVNRPALWRANSRDIGFFALLVMFAFVGALALIMNADLYTKTQLKVCFVYLAKYAQMSLLYIFVSFFLSLMVL